MRNVFFKVALVFTILTGVAGFLFSKLVFLSFEDPVDIYAEDFDITEHGEGGRIETEIFASYGSCATETLTSSKNGTVTSSSTDYYYVVPVFDKNGNEYCICIKVDQDDKALFNRITNDTYSYLDGAIDGLYTNTYNFEGTIEELDEELYDYMLESLRSSWEFESEAELRSYALPLCLNTMNYSAAPTYMIIFIVLLVLTILFWVLFFIRRSKIKATNANAANSMAMGNGMYGVPTANPDPYNNQYNANAYNNNAYSNDNTYNNGYSSNEYNANINTDSNTNNNQ